MLYRHEILSGVWMMNPDSAINYLPTVISFLKGNRFTPLSINSEAPLNEYNGVLFASASNALFPVEEYSRYQTPENAPNKSIAIVSISGAITKYDQLCGPAGMVTKANLLDRCFANDNIEGIILKIDSGGGQGIAMNLLCDALKKKNKAVVAYIEDMACSAAYGIASACDMIVANYDFADIGSIGTYVTIADYSKQLEMEGISITELYATASKDKNGMIRKALAGDTKELQAYVDTWNDFFLTTVEKNRGEKLKSDRSIWGTGKVYFAKEALSLGLIDAIDSLDNIINYFKS